MKNVMDVFVVVNGQWFVEVLPFPYDSMTVYIRVCHVKKERRRREINTHYMLKQERKEKKAGCAVTRVKDTH